MTSPVPISYDEAKRRIDDELTIGNDFAVMMHCAHCDMECEEAREEMKKIKTLDNASSALHLHLMVCEDCRDYWQYENRNGVQIYKLP